MGFIILIVFAAYVLISTGLMIAAHIIGKRKNLKWCNWWAAGLVMLLIPIWDIPIGQTYYNYLCNSNAGQYIYKKTKLNNDFLYKAGEINKSKLNGKEDSYAIAKGGEINHEKLKKEYDYFSQNSSETSIYSHIFNISRRISVIKNKDSGTLLSKAISYSYKGGWVANIYNPHGGVNCSRDKDSSNGYDIHSTLFNNTFFIGQTDSR